MKRALAMVGLMGAAALLMAARPAGEFPMFLRLNGQPTFIGRSMPGADGGTVGIVDAGLGQVTKTRCYAAACVCPGISCTCSLGQATTGQKLAADGVEYIILDNSTTLLSTAAVSGSLLPDGGAGAWCDHWVMN